MSKAAAALPADATEDERAEAFAAQMRDKARAKGQKFRPDREANAHDDVKDGEEVNDDAGEEGAGSKRQKVRRSFRRLVARQRASACVFVKRAYLR